MARTSTGKRRDRDDLHGDDTDHGSADPDRPPAAKKHKRQRPAPEAPATAPVADQAAPTTAGSARLLPAPGPDAELLDAAAETFSLLSSPTRLHLLWLLARGGMDVGSLASTVGASTALVSQHLAKLRLADLVRARRDGKRQIYLVDDAHVITLVHQALEHHADLQHPTGSTTTT